MSAYFLKTRRLGFRCWASSDLDLALGLWGDPEVTRNIEANGLVHEEIEARLAAEIAARETTGVQYWPIFLVSTGEHVGCCGLRPRDPDEAVYELGVHIRSPLWRRGYACEATRGVIHHAFSNLGVRRLFAGHNPANAASRSLLAKLGFRYTHDEPYAPTGLEHPSYLLEPPRPPIV